MNEAKCNGSDRLTAFRLSAELLAEVDAVCESCDLTRSQFYRRSVVEAIDRHRNRRESQRPG